MEFLWVRSLVKRGRCLWFHGRSWKSQMLLHLGARRCQSPPLCWHYLRSKSSTSVHRTAGDGRRDFQWFLRCKRWTQSVAQMSKPFLSIRQLLKAFFLHPLPTKSFTLKLDYKGLLGKAQNAAQGTSRSHEEWSVILEIKSCDVNGLTKQLPSCIWNYGKCLQILLNTFGPHCNFAGKVSGMCSIMSL